MHELAVTESLLQIALERAGNAGATGVMDLYVVMGEMSSIVDDSVQFYWDIIAQDTIAQNAQLHFRRLPAEFICLDCNTRYRPEGDSFGCPQCGSIRVRMDTGNEFYLEAIDVRP